MTVVSPWSRGGWINSQVFDHTSVLRFLELWTAVREPNISTWRRAICGDLTSCFDFGTPVTRIPLLPDTAALRSEADRRDATLPSPAPPAAGEQAAPVQEPGTAPARALPYQAWANAWHSAGAVHLRLGNVGLAALQVQVYDLTSASPARRVDLAPAGSRALAIAAVAGYQVAVHGPNGFLREVHGDATSEGMEASLRVTGTYDAPGLRLTLTNATSRTVTFVVQGAGSTKRIPVTNAARALDLDPVRTSQGWYDLRVRLDGVAGYLRRFAGHLENGRPSITG
jgi:phospholipase C